MGVRVGATPLWGVLSSEWWTSACRSDSTHANTDAIGSHLLDSVANAVQRCTSMALRVSRERGDDEGAGCEGGVSGADVDAVVEWFVSA